MKIVLAVDHSPHSDLVIREAAARPWPAGTDMRVLNVVDMYLLTSSGGYLEVFAEKIHEEARSLTEAAAQQLAARGLVATPEVIEAHPGPGIVDYARDWGADFILVGSHGHSGVARFFLGSVAKSVVHNAHCSVEVLRPLEPVAETRGPMKILLGTDGSEYSEAAARSLAARPWPAGSEVRVISAVDVIAPAVDPWYAAGAVVEQLREERTRLAREAVSAGAAIVTGAGLAVSADVPPGNPRGVLVDEAEAWGADLIVVGSHGRRGLKRLLLGSVSEAVALHAHCSVEVIRHTS